MRLKLTRTTVKACLLLVIYVTYVSARPSREDLSEEVDSEEDNDDDDNESDDDDDDDDSKQSISGNSLPTPVVTSDGGYPTYVENLKKLVEYLEKFIQKYITPNSNATSAPSSTKLNETQTNTTTNLQQREPKKPISVTPALLQSLAALLQSLKKPLKPGATKPLPTLSQIPGILEMLKPMIGSQAQVSAPVTSTEPNTLAGIVSANATETASSPQGNIGTENSTTVQNTGGEQAADATLNATSPQNAATQQDSAAPQSATASPDSTAAQDVATTQDTVAAGDAVAAEDAGAAQDAVAAQDTAAAQDAVATQDTIGAQGAVVAQDVASQVDNTPNQVALETTSTSESVTATTNHSLTSTEPSTNVLDPVVISSVVPSQDLSLAEISAVNQNKPLDVPIPAQAATAVEYPSLVQNLNAVEITANVQSPSNIETPALGQESTVVDTVPSLSIDTAQATNQYPNAVETPVIQPQEPVATNQDPIILDSININAITIAETPGSLPSSTMPEQTDVMSSPIQNPNLIENSTQENVVTVQDPNQFESLPTMQDANLAGIAEVQPYPALVETPDNVQETTTYETSETITSPAIPEASLANQDVANLEVPADNPYFTPLEIPETIQSPSEAEPSEFLYPNVVEAEAPSLGSQIGSTASNSFSDLTQAISPLAIQSVSEPVQSTTGPDEFGAETPTDPHPFLETSSSNMVDNIIPSEAYPIDPIDPIEFTTEHGMVTPESTSPVDVSSMASSQSLSIPDPLPAPPIQQSFATMVEALPEQNQDIQPGSFYEPPPQFATPSHQEAYEFPFQAETALPPLAPTELQGVDTSTSPAIMNAMEQAEAEAEAIFSPADPSNMEPGQWSPSIVQGEQTNANVYAPAQAPSVEGQGAITQYEQDALFEANGSLLPYTEAAISAMPTFDAPMYAEPSDTNLDFSNDPIPPSSLGFPAGGTGSVFSPEEVTSSAFMSSQGPNLAMPSSELSTEGPFNSGVTEDSIGSGISALFGAPASSVSASGVSNIPEMIDIQTPPNMGSSFPSSITSGTYPEEFAQSQTYTPPSISQMPPAPTFELGESIPALQTIDMLQGISSVPNSPDTFSPDTIPIQPFALDLQSTSTSPVSTFQSEPTFSSASVGPQNYPPSLTLIQSAAPEQTSFQSSDAGTVSNDMTSVQSEGSLSPEASAIYFGSTITNAASQMPSNIQDTGVSPLSGASGVALAEATLAEAGLADLLTPEAENIPPKDVLPVEALSPGVLITASDISPYEQVSVFDPTLTNQAPSKVEPKDPALSSLSGASGIAFAQAALAEAGLADLLPFEPENTTPVEALPLEPSGPGLPITASDLNFPEKLPASNPTITNGGPIKVDLSDPTLASSSGASGIALAEAALAEAGLAEFLPVEAEPEGMSPQTAITATDFSPPEFLPVFDPTAETSPQIDTLDSAVYPLSGASGIALAEATLAEAGLADLLPTESEPSQPVEPMEQQVISTSSGFGVADQLPVFEPTAETSPQTDTLDPTLNPLSGASGIALAEATLAEAGLADLLSVDAVSTLPVNNQGDVLPMEAMVPETITTAPNMDRPEQLPVFDTSTTSAIQVPPKLDISDPMQDSPSGVSGIALAEAMLAQAGLADLLPPQTSSPAEALPAEAMAPEVLTAASDLGPPEQLPVFDVSAISTAQEPPKVETLYPQPGISPGASGVALAEAMLAQAGLADHINPEAAANSPTDALPVEEMAPEVVTTASDLGPPERLPVFDVSAISTAQEPPKVETLYPQPGISPGASGVALAEAMLAQAGLADHINPEAAANSPTDALPVEEMAPEVVTTATDLGPPERLPVFDVSAISTAQEPPKVETLYPQPGISPGASGVALAEAMLAQAGLADLIPPEGVATSPTEVIPVEEMAPEVMTTVTNLGPFEQLPVFDASGMANVQEPSYQQPGIFTGANGVALAEATLAQAGLADPLPTEAAATSSVQVLPGEAMAPEVITTATDLGPPEQLPVFDTSGNSNIQELSYQQPGVLTGASGIASAQAALAQAGLADLLPPETSSPAEAFPVATMAPEIASTATDFGTPEQLPVVDASSISTAQQPSQGVPSDPKPGVFPGTTGIALGLENLYPKEPVASFPVEATSPQTVPSPTDASRPVTLGTLPIFFPVNEKEPAAPPANVIPPDEIPVNEQTLQDLFPDVMTDIYELFNEAPVQEITTQANVPQTTPGEIILSEIIPADAIPIISLGAATTGAPQEAFPKPMTASQPAYASDPVVAFVSPATVGSTDHQFTGFQNQSPPIPATQYPPPMYGPMINYPPPAELPPYHYNQVPPLGTTSSPYPTGGDYMYPPSSVASVNNGYMGPTPASQQPVSIPLGNYQTILDEGALVGPIIGPDGDEHFPPPMIVEANVHDPAEFENIIAAEYLKDGRSTNSSEIRAPNETLNNATADDESPVEILHDAVVETTGEKLLEKSPSPLLPLEDEAIPSERGLRVERKEAPVLTCRNCTIRIACTDCVKFRPEIILNGTRALPLTVPTPGLEITATSNIAEVLSKFSETSSTPKADTYVLEMNNVEASIIGNEIKVGTQAQVEIRRATLEESNLAKHLESRFSPDKTKMRVDVPLVVDEAVPVEIPVGTTNLRTVDPDIVRLNV